MSTCQFLQTIAVLAICMLAIFSSRKFLVDITSVDIGSRRSSMIQGTAKTGGGGGSGSSYGGAGAGIGSAGTSGSLFQMKKIRDISQINGKLLFQNRNDWWSDTRSDINSGFGQQQHDMLSELWPTSVSTSEGGDFWNPTHLNCKNWGALTTIFEVTVAASYMSTLPNWCLVVAGDLKGPTSYNVDDPNSQIIFLSAERQQELQQHLTFVQRTPWNHFSRKNIAFLYAIANGAEYIWDFDDDNILWGRKENLLTEVYTKPITQYSYQKASVVQIDNVDNKACRTFNPYSIFQPSNPNIWPRGYPLEDMHKPECQIASTTTYCKRTVSHQSIGIYQSVADGDPDVDAIYRLTQELPVHFAGSYDGHGITPVVIPPHTMSPMNAQATLIARSAMWSMFLPTTVHGRVSDIWRSYIAQTLGKTYGMLSVFMGPIVTQDRNAHNYLADFQSEEPLYERAGVLIEYLLNWRYNSIDGSGDHPTHPTFEGAMEKLYVDLYEHGILEWEDVELVQLWIQTLQSVGYEFPEISTLSLEQEQHPVHAMFDTPCELTYEIPTKSSASASSSITSSTTKTKKKKKKRKKTESSLTRSRTKRQDDDDRASSEQEDSPDSARTSTLRKRQSEDASASTEQDNSGSAESEGDASASQEDNASASQDGSASAEQETNGSADQEGSDSNEQDGGASADQEGSASSEQDGSASPDHEGGGASFGAPQTE